MPTLKSLYSKFLLCAILLSAFFLRLFRLGEHELRGDESFGYFFSLSSFDEILRNTLELAEPHPVASYFLQHLWLNAAGHSEMALRFLTAAFGVLAVALLYRLGRRLALGEGAALLGAALLALSPYAIWHSQDARMYTLSLALTLASSWLALLVYEEKRWRYGVAYVAVSWLALHNHYFAAFIVVAQNIYLLSHAVVTRQSAGLRRWIAAQLLLGVSYLPWLWVARSIIGGYRGNGDSPAFSAMLERSLGVFAAGESVPVEQRPWVALLVALLLLIGLASLLRSTPQRRWGGWLLVLYLAVPLGATWISSLSRPIFNERYLIAASPPFYLLIAVAVSAFFDSARFKRLLPTPLHWGYGALVGSLFAVLLLGMGRSLVSYYEDPARRASRWSELVVATEQLASAMPPGEVRVALNFPEPTYWYYYQGSLEHLLLPPAAQDREGTKREVDKLVAAGVTWVVFPAQPAPHWDGQGIAQSELAEAYTLISERQVHDWPLQLYVRVDPARMRPAESHFANGLELIATALQPTEAQGTLRPGHALAVHLRWAGAGAALSGSEKLFIHVLDSVGQPVAQQDPLLSQGDLTGGVNSYGILVPEGLAEGRYRVVVGLYDPGQPGAPRLVTTEGDDSVELGFIQVKP